MATAPPLLDRRLLAPLLENRLRQAGDRRLVLVYGTYDPSSQVQFDVAINNGGHKRSVHVTDQPSVLGIASAWLDHQERADPTSVLVVTTTANETELDWDLLGHVVKQAVLNVDPIEVVQLKFGASRLDPQVWEQPWLLTALLAAEPADGWPRTGGVLTYDAALRALTAARLGVPGDGLDFDGLLAWTQTPGGPERFQQLDHAERKGISEWLAASAGDAVAPLLTLVEIGRADDAMALGVVGTAIHDPQASTDVAAAVGGLFPNIPAAAIRTFATAVEHVITRTLATIHSRRNGDERVEAVTAALARADQLASQTGLTDALASSTVLPSAFRARLSELANALPDPTRAGAALRQAQDHQLAGLRQHELRAAEMAVRIARWLTQPTSDVPSVANGVAQYLAEWSWVDRALDVLWAGDDHAGPHVTQAYRRLVEEAVRRRTEVDKAFATRVVPWAKHASVHAPDGCLLVEEVLNRAAVPLAASGPPLIVVVDGMSGAIASELGEQLADAWYEVSPEPDRRLVAVATIPSITMVSRASLLCGKFTDGGQPVERAGFSAFWKRRHKQANLFHQADIGGGAGEQLSSEVVTALAGDDVVGVVLNTIDDALDHGREKAGWQLSDIRFLPQLLAQARNYGRPVLLVADHGHVVDRGGDGPRPANGDRGARWRTGKPDDGEVAGSGPRVYGDEVVVPWREDVRYTYRKAGYHGGVAPAEMTVPVLALVPAVDGVPRGWSTLATETVRPDWWEPKTPSEAPSTTSVPAAPRKRRPTEQDGALFDLPRPTPAAQESLGSLVVASEVYQGQKAFVSRAPDTQVVVRIVDGLAEAGDRVSISAVAAMAGKAARRAEGLLTTLERLLNVEGYPVLEKIDSGRRVTLNVPLLREQFKVGDT
ncbi:BREX-2 system phosphatase PglZ [Haloechinothrix salitolerans]|uniref:BREX-2 system phosphatase PglZ n=1 Tax=Haloechinothrix salitolerans TaxID=926830 RepID=A0ABW2CBW1_9PSEU